ncbi:aldo-keto reductase-8 [Coleophoma cylindrospora]|uniref:Aldo-keto reductase-8 n=1 Tax=Coleophoma cylindrospora TaxID=1849047 RepID=A0A3D8RB55_9HELO|nr:aldo-keto reductase-8 [Coleophoma cylindrospora]
MSKSKAAVNIVFGAMTIGKAGGLEGSRISTIEETSAVLDVFQQHGYNEVDNARTYAAGTCEQFFADANWEKRGLIMTTKLYPTASKNMKDVHRGLLNSLEALKSKTIDMWYLHGPDRTTRFEVILAEVDKLHKGGYFKRLGVSNFQSWEVAQVCEICKKNGWIMPSAYQGIYNALHRGTEPVLLPCLRYYGISLYAFQPLAGGFLTGRYQRDSSSYAEGSRFDPKRAQGMLHHGRYWKPEYFDALGNIQAATGRHGLTMAEAALRWLIHHSLVQSDKGDAVIIGASSAEQLEANLTDMGKGPLPEDVVNAVNDGWEMAKGRVPNYWH